MSKISKALKAIRLIVKNPALLNNILDSSDEWEKYVKTKYQLNTGLQVVKPEQLFDITENTVYPYTFTDGGSLITDLLLLKNAAASFEKCLFFEFGTWRGESVANVANIAKECYTLNLSDIEMKELNLSLEYINQIGMFSKSLKNVHHLKGNSLDFNYSGLNEKFDLVFIDGNHHYKYVKSDTQNTFAHLVHEKSIIIWHDYAYDPETVRNQVLAGILDGTPQEKHKCLYHVEGTKCAVYFPKEIAGENLEQLKVPDVLFKINVEIIQK